MQPQNCVFGFCTKVQIQGQLFSRAWTPFTMRLLGLLEGGFCGRPQVPLERTEGLTGFACGATESSDGAWCGTGSASGSLRASLVGVEEYDISNPLRLFSSLSNVWAQKSTTTVDVELLIVRANPAVMYFWTTAEKTKYTSITYQLDWCMWVDIENNNYMYDTPDYVKIT